MQDEVNQFQHLYHHHQQQQADLQFQAQVPSSTSLAGHNQHTLLTTNASADSNQPQHEQHSSKKKRKC